MNADAVSSLTASVKSNYSMFSLTVSHTHTHTHSDSGAGLMQGSWGAASACRKEILCQF